MSPPPWQAVAEQLRQGHWLEALSEARTLRSSPSDDLAWIEAVLARAYVRMGCPAEALEAATSAARAQTGSLITLALAESELASGEPGAARSKLQALLEEVLSNDVKHEATLSLCTVLRASGEAEVGYGLACGALDRADVRNDELAAEEALIVVGHTAWASGLVLEAQGAFERALEERNERDAPPTLRAEALDGLGLCARHRTRPFDAVQHHRDALKLWIEGTGEKSGPVSACSHRLAQALHRTGDFEAAREEMSRSLLATGQTLGRDHVDTWITRFELARYEMDCGDPEHGLPRMVNARDEVARRLGRTHPVVVAMDRFL
ncbi:MAG: tetratricopeptide repeat protein [Myxococcota bacterium]